MATQGQTAELVPELQAWHKAKERADVHNRNLLQYFAILGAFLGLAAGSSGLLAVAASLRDDGGFEWWATVIVALAGAAIAVVAIALTALAFREFQMRQAAEHDAEVHFARLIALDPDRYLPKVE